MNELKVILIFLLISLNSVASEEIKVVTEHFPPYQIVKEGKPVSGSSVEFIEALLKEVNIDTKIEVYPWARAYSMAITYPNVLIFSISRTPERESLFHWIGALDAMCNHLWALKKNNSIKITSIDDAREHIVGVPRDDTVHHYLKKHGFRDSDNLYIANTREQAVKMLFSGRVELLMGAELLIKQRVNHLGFDFNHLKNVFTLPVINNNRLSIAFSKSTPTSLVLKFQKAFKKLKESPQYRNMSSDINCGSA